MTKVLFACVENACRSQMAEGFARRHSLGDIKVSSGGTEPANQISENAVKVMKEKNIDISRQTPTEITSLKAKNADLVVTMGCDPEACPAPIGRKSEEWNIEDPSGKSLEKFREIRDVIEQKVLTMLKHFG